MEIKIGKYTMTSDPLNFIITETKKLRINKDGSKLTGKGSKFFLRIPDALNYLVEQKLRLSEAKTILELKKDFYKAQEWVQEQFKEI